MSKHLTKDCFYTLPSGAQVHPCRLILKDGTLMWKHALLSQNKFTALPQTQAHEQHIIKTAQRLEELNTWVSQDLEPWECLMPISWYDPCVETLSQGCRVYFYHPHVSSADLYERLKDHIQPHETLGLQLNAIPAHSSLYFQRC